MLPCFEKKWRFLKILNTELPYDPVIPLIGLYPRERNTYVHTKTCTWMFRAALFKIMKTIGNNPNVH